MLSDYNCRILNIDRYKLYLGDESALKAEFQKIIDDVNILGSLGFHKLVCQVKHNFLSPASSTKKYIASLKRLIRKETAHRLEGKFNIHVVPSVYLSEDTPYIKDIKNLTAPKTNYIFLELPFANMPEYIPQAINKILYSQKLIPVFTDFHIHNSIYSAEEINRLVSIKGAAFQFDLSNSLLPQNIKTIKRILNNGNTALIGTSCDHFNLNRSEIDRNTKALKKLLGDNYYMTLILRARSFLS